MKPANTAKRLLGDSKLLVIAGENKVIHSQFDRLEDFMEPGDLLIVNRSATLPSSFRGHLQRTGEFVELRLAAFQGPCPEDLQNWMAFTFGTGDWRQPTEERGESPELRVLDKIIFSEDLIAEIIHVKHGRLLQIRFSNSSGLSNLQSSLYKHGRPIQYSYHKQELDVWDQQTIFSGPPVSVEPPSASFQFTWDQLFKLRAKGVQVATVLHSAGISSTGDKKLDKLLPLKEWYQVPKKTVALINQAKTKGKKLVALGTTVLRALESATVDSELRARSGLASLKITPGFHFHHINALLTGMHEPGSSHMLLLDSLCPFATVQEAYRQAVMRSYRGHEYGDLSLLNCKAD